MHIRLYLRSFSFTFGGDVSAAEALGYHKAHVVGHGACVHCVSNAAHFWKLCKFCGTKILRQQAAPWLLMGDTCSHLASALLKHVMLVTWRGTLYLQHGLLLCVKRKNQSWLQETRHTLPA